MEWFCRVNPRRDFGLLKLKVKILEKVINLVEKDTLFPTSIFKSHTIKISKISSVTGVSYLFNRRLFYRVQKNSVDYIGV